MKRTYNIMKNNKANITMKEKYFKPVDEIWGERTDENPYLDMLFGMIEINGIELY